MEEAPVFYGLIKRVLAALERENVRYVVFGAVALSLLGLARATEDLDIFIEATEENIAALKRALRSVFDDANIDEITSDDLLGDYPSVRYVPPVGAFYMDILTRLGEAYRYDNLESQRVEFEGVTVTVVTPKMLYDMKRRTVRPKDWGDALRLKSQFRLEDE